MDIIQLLKLVSVIVPAASGFVQVLLTAIHTAPGTPEHTDAITKSVVSIAPVAAAGETPTK